MVGKEKSFQDIQYVVREDHILDAYALLRKDFFNEIRMLRKFILEHFPKPADGQSYPENQLTNHASESARNVNTINLLSASADLSGVSHQTESIFNFIPHENSPIIPCDKIDMDTFEQHDTSSQTAFPSQTSCKSVPCKISEVSDVESSFSLKESEENMDALLVVKQEIIEPSNDIQATVREDAPDKNRSSCLLSLPPSPVFLTAIDTSAQCTSVVEPSFDIETISDGVAITKHDMKFVTERQDLLNQQSMTNGLLSMKSNKKFTRNIRSQDKCVSSNKHQTRTSVIFKKQTERRFQRTYQLRKRLKQHKPSQSECSPYSCNICQKDFVSLYGLLGHMKIHKWRKGLCCNVCRKKFALKYSLKKHMAIHSEQGQMLSSGSFRCNSRIKSRARHYSTVSATFEDISCLNNKNSSLSNEPLKSSSRKMSCDTCGELFELHKELVAHMKYHAKQPLACNPRSNSFTSKEIKDPLKKYKSCKACKKYFRSNEAYDLHRERHLPIVSCKICDDFFPHEVALGKHMLEHVEEEFLCDTCGKSFEMQKQLDSHLKIDHNEPFSCDVCEKGFTSMICFNKHMKKHETFSCKYCNKSFLSEKLLNKHISCHVNLSCCFCDKSFNLRTQLRNHLKKVHEYVQPSRSLASYKPLR